MRFLFSFAGGSGHFLPTEVFARALARRGHEVLYTCQEAMVSTVMSAGWQVEPSGGASLLDAAARRPLVPVDRAHEERVMRGFFAGRGARERAHGLVEVIAKRRPDLVVHDEVDFGAAVAAEAMGVPHAGVVVIAAGRLTRPEVIESALAAVRAEFGLTTGSAWDALHRYLLLVPVPPTFRDPQIPLPVTARYVRPAILDAPPAAAMTSSSRGAGQFPQVYFTLGTIFPQESGDLFGRALTALAALHVEAVVTTGGAITPAELGRHGGRVRIEQFVPLSDALAHRDAVISRGGSGTVIASLALGQPQVVLPMGADQPDNADRCEELGVGVALDALTASPTHIADAVAAVLDASSPYRMNARRVGEDVQNLHDSEHASSHLEAVARTRSAVTGCGLEPNV